MSSWCECFDCEICSSEDSEPEVETPWPPDVMTLESASLTKEENHPEENKESSDAHPANIRRPQLSIKKQLFSMTGWNVAVYNNGKVRGTNQLFSSWAILNVTAVARGEVQIRGEESGLYIAMTRRGRLYGETNSSKANTIWAETIAGSFFNYLSKKYAHKGWYLAVKKSGKPKRGKKTGYGQRAVQFLPRHPQPV